MKYILSYGGGVNSSALFFYLLNVGAPLDAVVFADTQEETERTYDAVRRMEEICKQRGIMFATVSAGSLYDYYEKKRCVMSVQKRDCTTKFKVAPIRKFLRQKYGKKETFTMNIGITYDEATRMKDSNVKYITNSYPFCDARISRRGNLDILREEGFTAVKSGCKGCIYTKKVEWLKMAIENPKEFKRHLHLDMNNRGYPKVTLSPNYPLEDIARAAKGQQSLSSYANVEPSCDAAGWCFL